MEENDVIKMKPSVGQSALTYALLFSIALIAVSLVLLLVDMKEGWVALAIIILVFAGGITLIMLDFRSKLNGFISYGKAVKIGFISVLFASIVMAGYSYINDIYIDPDALTEGYAKEYTKAMKDIDEMDEFSPEQKSNTKKYTKISLRYKYTPWIRAVSVPFLYAIFGIIFALIIAIFIQRKEPLQIYEDPA